MTSNSTAWRLGLLEMPRCRPEMTLCTRDSWSIRTGGGPKGHAPGRL
eukprot:CAMPEP_0119276146 /NCGR_PEP_ID=MMETSP1329-20130426/14949_1 /TAXON_ID=114041 /ORGANISM="Genus nov. species nov., Strain RCC1024" /LENGTH=46 /DNA_ID= /DNA_START= /DNA_END= /DNA_ORIENTATION=